FFTREAWLPYVLPHTPGSTAEDNHDHCAGGEAQQVKLSPQAQGNLRLVTRPLTAETFWRTIQVPGMVVDRPAQSDRRVGAPVTGVVTKVHHFPGDTVKPGATLITLRLLSETMHLTQSELFKTSREIEFARDQKNRLAAAAGAIPEGKLVEVDNQLKRLTVA